MPDQFSSIIMSQLAQQYLEENNESLEFKNDYLVTLLQVEFKFSAKNTNQRFKFFLYSKFQYLTYIGFGSSQYEEKCTVQSGVCIRQTHLILSELFNRLKALCTHQNKYQQDFRQTGIKDYMFQELWTGIDVNHQSLNFNLPQTIISPNQQHQISDSQIVTIGIVVDMLVASGVGIGKTPYDLLKQIKNLYGLNSSTVSAINNLLDYTLTLSETFLNKSFDVLGACIMIYVSHNNINQWWATQILSTLNDNAAILKEQIELNLEAELM